MPSTKQPAESLTIDGIKLSITHPDKILWPEEGYTKADLINYYRFVAKYILPHVKERPQSQHRYPNGIHGQSFYKKNMEEAPEWAETFDVPNESEGGNTHYLICNNEATLVYMANLACIELNPWNSRTTSLEYPDWIVLDIDPSPTNTFDEVVETALVIKSVLDKIKVDSYPKTSGATGLHVYIPMGAQYSYEQARMFANIVAEHAHAQLTRFTSLVRNLKERGNKIYIDFLQNSKGQTLASAYSVRPMTWATVSTPLRWDEVKPGLLPAHFHIKNVPDRLKKTGDIFKPVLGKGIDLEKCLSLLG